MLTLYGSTQIASLCAIALSELAVAWQCLLFAACLAHAGWTLPRHILLSDARAWRGIRHDDAGWALWCAAQGWQPVHLMPDSVALPIAVVLRFKGERPWWSVSVCIPCDALTADQHRRLRVRLKFSRRRWAAPG